MPDGKGLLYTELPGRISEVGSKYVVTCFPESRSDGALVWRDRNQSRRKQCSEDAGRRNLLQTGHAVVP